MGRKKKQGKKQQQQENQDVEEKVENQTKQQKTKAKQEDKNEEVQDKKQQKPIILPKKVSYCPICTLSFELCQYGKKAGQCLKFLQQAAPTKVSKYHPNAGEMKVEKEQEKKDQIKKQKGAKSKYIVIDVKQRTKKKHITTISGLQNFSVDSKQLAKKASKKFACSAANIDEDTVQIQGDVYEEVKELLTEDYKVKSKYIITQQKFSEKVKQQSEKKKQEKKIQQNSIKQDPRQHEDEEKKVSESKKQQKKEQEEDEQEDEQDTLKLQEVLEINKKVLGSQEISQI